MNVESCTLSENERGYDEDEQGRGSYEVEFKVIVTPDNAGTNDYGHGAKVVAQAASVGPDPLPLRGDGFNFYGIRDFSSFCKTRSARLEDPQDPTIYLARASFSPIDTQQGETLAQLKEPNPLLHPPVPYLTFTEEQVPLEEAKMISADAEGLIAAGRTLNSVGPIVNGANVQTIDPLTKSRFRVLLNFDYNFASIDTLMALNATFEDTMNSKTFFGAPARTVRYVVTQAGKPQIKEVPGLGIVEYYPGTIQFEYNKVNWDRSVLNNGMAAFVKTGGSYEEEDSKPKLFDIKVADPDDPTKASRTSEPLNLNLDGTFTQGVPGNFIMYEDLTPIDFSQIGLERMLKAGRRNGLVRV